MPRSLRGQFVPKALTQLGRERLARCGRVVALPEQRLHFIMVMVIMILDHARDYFSDIQANPTNLETASAALFFTRWVTHV